jgi:PIN domain nuclease of toxin-antitoxin system
MAIKVSTGKLTLTKPVEHFITEQLALNPFTLLLIGLDDVARVARLAAG